MRKSLFFHCFSTFTSLRCTQTCFQTIVSGLTRIDCATQSLISACRHPEGFDSGLRCPSWPRCSSVLPGLFSPSPDTRRRPRNTAVRLVFPSVPDCVQERPGAEEGSVHRLLSSSSSNCSPGISSCGQERRAGGRGAEGGRTALR